MRNSWIRALFVVAGIYETVLGLTFFFLARQVYRWAGLIPPNHFGYVRFPALLLIIFGAMFFRIAQDAVRNRELILYGVALKASYSGLVFWYELHGGLPGLWLAWAWADLVFLI